ncbi:hypothetical protein AVEN_4098-1 [Araneus ventricosus]|uniref:Integrase catalytic domain-containing protein n=1 Tax=Araneus ventricosus TaxID=182803 RepID=A0A4Y2IWA4_ARAVE|nr:hypothetical protein AVEN_4098-1 [Araneus ventricosus]
MPQMTSMGRITDEIEVDNVKGEGISIYVVHDDAQPVDLIIGRTWFELPHIAYTRIGKIFNIGYQEDEPFINFPIDGKINRICLKALEATKVEKKYSQYELGSTNLTKIDIKEVEGSKPVCMKPYNTNTPEKAAIREIVREWRENGIVSDTRAPYASPVLLVEKKTGDNRLVNKVPSGKRQGFLHTIPTGRRPFAIVNLDHLGPFVTSSERYKELPVIIYNMTIFVSLYPVRNTSPENVFKSVKNFVEDFGIPNRIISDRDSCFTSHELQRFCGEIGIFHILNSTSHPQGNGMF